MTPAVPDLSAGFVHKGRIVYALEYWLEVEPPQFRQVIVWLNPSGDSQTGGVVHSDPSRRIVTTKPGEQIRVHGQLETVKVVNVYRSSSLAPEPVTGIEPPTFHAMQSD